MGTRILVGIASLAVIALIIGAVLVLRGTAVAPNASEKAQTSSASVTPGASTAPGKLIVTDVVVGTGAEAKTDSTVKTKYTGKLADGTVFDSTDKNGGQAIEFPLSGVIKGWQQGIPGMKVGGKRTLVIPPDLAYGAQGTQGIPPNSTLTFDIELVEVK